MCKMASHVVQSIDDFPNRYARIGLELLQITGGVDGRILFEKPLDSFSGNCGALMVPSVRREDGLDGRSPQQAACFPIQTLKVPEIMELHCHLEFPDSTTHSPEKLRRISPKVVAILIPQLKQLLNFDPHSHCGETRHNPGFGIAPLMPHAA
jgi:hypothetical protein